MDNEHNPVPGPDTGTRRKPAVRKRRRLFFNVFLCLGTALIVSSAYLVYMFNWTTYQVNLEASNRRLQEDCRALENSFRVYVKSADDFAEATGFSEPDEEDLEPEFTALREDLVSEMEAINKTLSSPLPPGKLNMRNLVAALALENRQAMTAVRTTRERMQEIRKEHEYEIKDLNMQALIQIHKIDRLEKRIQELEGGK